MHHSQRGGERERKVESYFELLLATFTPTHKAMAGEREFWGIFIYGEKFCRGFICGCCFWTCGSLGVFILAASGWMWLFLLGYWYYCFSVVAAAPSVATLEGAVGGVVGGVEGVELPLNIFMFRKKPDTRFKP